MGDEENFMKPGEMIDFMKSGKMLDIDEVIEAIDEFFPHIEVECELDVPCKDCEKLDDCLEIITIGLQDSYVFLRQLFLHVKKVHDVLAKNTHEWKRLWKLLEGRGRSIVDDERLDDLEAPRKVLDEPRNKKPSRNGGIYI